MFGAKARKLEVEANEKYRATQKRLNEATKAMRLHDRRAQGFLSAGEFSEAAAECHRAHQQHLVTEALQKELWPDG